MIILFLEKQYQKLLLIDIRHRGDKNAAFRSAKTPRPK